MGFPKILFLTAGGEHPEYSTGHLSRCFLTIQQMKKREPNAEFLFLIPKDRVGEALVRKNGFTPNVISSFEAQEARVRQFITNENPDILILDRLDWKENFVKNLRRLGKPIVLLDDSGTAVRHCDLSINPLIKNALSDENSYAYLTLSESAMKPRKLPKKVSRCLISLGGYDPQNVAETILTIMSKQPWAKQVEVNVFLSAGVMPHRRAQTLVNSFAKSSKIFQYSKEFFNVLEKCDTAIVAGGLTLFECSSRSMVTGAIELRAHQRSNIKSLEKEGAALYLGTPAQISRKAFISKLEAMFFDERKRSIFFNKSLRYWRIVKKEKRCDISDLELLATAKGSKVIVWPKRLTEAVLTYAAKYRQHRHIKRLFTFR